MRRRIVIGCYADVRSGGGGVCLTRHVAEGLAERGHSVRVLSPGEGPESAEGGYRVTYFRNESGRLWRVPALERVGRLARGLRENGVEKPDAVLAVSAPWVLASKKVWPQVPVVFLFPCLVWRCLPRVRREEGFFSRLDDWILKRQDREGLCRTDRIVAQSRGVAEDIERFVPGARRKVHVAPTGVEDLRMTANDARERVRASLETAADGFVGIAVGSLDGNKNQDFILRSLARAACDRFWVWVVGEGPDRARLESLAAELGVASRVRFTGWRKDVGSLYSAADVLIHSAWYDCFPNVYLEAMVSGLPVIGPRNDGGEVFSSLEEIIVPEKEGFVYSLKETEGLASLMRRICGDPARLREMGQRARAKALERYSWNGYLDAVESAIAAAVRAFPDTLS